jgi:hypothetical protein
MALCGAYADAPQAPGAPSPPYGHREDGRDDLKQVLLCLGVSGDGALPPARGPARWPPLAPVGRETRADPRRSAPALAGPTCAPVGGGRVQRRARHPGGSACCGRAFESTGTAATPDLCRGASERSRGRGRPRAAGARPVVRLPARCRNGSRRVCVPGAGVPRTPPTPVALSHCPRSPHGRHPPHTPCPSGPASEDGPTSAEPGVC